MRESPHLIYIPPQGDPRLQEQSIVPGLAASRHALLLPPLWKCSIARCDYEMSLRLSNYLVGNSIAWTSWTIGLVLPGNSSVAKEEWNGWAWQLLVLRTSDITAWRLLPSCYPFLALCCLSWCPPNRSYSHRDSVSSPWRNINVVQGGRVPFWCSAPSDWKITLHLPTPLVTREALVQIILPFIRL